MNKKVEQEPGVALCVSIIFVGYATMMRTLIPCIILFCACHLNAQKLPNYTFVDDQRQWFAATFLICMEPCISLIGACSIWVIHCTKPLKVAAKGFIPGKTKQDDFNNASCKAMLQKWLGVKPGYLKLQTITALLNNGQAVNLKVFNQLAVDKMYRPGPYDDLKKYINKVFSQNNI